MLGLVPFERKNNEIQRYNSLFDIDRIFENFFNDTVFPSLYSNSSHMRVDIRETEKDYILEADLPGVEKEDINIEIHDNRLTISVQSDEKKEEQKGNYIRRERRLSSMVRTFAIDNIQSDKISAKYENGVLVLTLPKKEEAKPKGRKINIS